MASLTYKHYIYLAGIIVLYGIIGYSYYGTEATRGRLVTYTGYADGQYRNWTDDKMIATQPAGSGISDIDFVSTMDTGNLLWNTVKVTFQPLMVLETEDMTWIELVIATMVTWFWRILGLLVVMQFVIAFIRNRASVA